MEVSKWVSYGDIVKKGVIYLNKDIVSVKVKDTSKYDHHDSIKLCQRFLQLQKCSPFMGKIWLIPLVSNIIQLKRAHTLYHHLLEKASENMYQLDSLCVQLSWCTQHRLFPSKFKIPRCWKSAQAATDNEAWQRQSCHAARRHRAITECVRGAWHGTVVLHVTCLVTPSHLQIVNVTCHGLQLSWRG